MATGVKLGLSGSNPMVSVLAMVAQPVSLSNTTTVYTPSLAPSPFPARLAKATPFADILISPAGGAVTELPS